EVEVTRVDVKDEDLVWHQLHENIHRSNLDPLDLSAAILHARDQGYNLAQIAGRMGKSETWVRKALTIATGLDDAARQTLQDNSGRPALDTVYAIAQAPTEAQAELARQVVAERLTRREAEALAAEAREGHQAEPSRRTGRRKKS